MPEAGTSHCERPRECDPGSARPSKKAGAEGVRRGDWGVGWKVTRKEMEPKQGWGQGWEGD